MQESSTKEQVTEVVGTAAQKTVDQAGQVVERGRGMVRAQLEERSTQVGDQIGSASQTLRQVADQARMDGNDQQARLAEHAAQRSERVSHYLIETDADQILNEIEDVARRQPWLVAGAGLLVGFAFARGLKASSGQRYENRYAGSHSPTPARPGYDQTWSDQPALLADPTPTVVSAASHDRLGE
jgi:hypothetical protein